MAHSVGFLLIPVVVLIPPLLSADAQSRDLSLTQRLEQTTKELEKCVKKINDQSYIGSVCTKVGSWLSKDTSMKSSVVKFLDKLELLSPSHTAGGVERDVTITLSSQHINILKQFALQDEGSPEHIEEILINSLNVKESMLDRTTDFFSQTMTETTMHFKANYVIIFQVTVLVVCVVLPLSLGSPKLPVFLLMCLYAVFTTWVKLYYIAAAKKQATLAKLAHIPHSCLLERQGWLPAAQHFVMGLFNGRQDPCEDYYTAAMVDPAWEVGLVAAVMETASVCVIIPAETVGTALGSYYTCLLQPLPWVWRLPVLLLATLSTLFPLLLVCGYELRIPFLLRIGPNKSSVTSTDNPPSVERPVANVCLDSHPSQECDMTDRGLSLPPYPQHRNELDHIIDGATNTRL